MSPRPTALPPPGSPDTLYLVDLWGYVFRAYHALPPMMSAGGEPTHATYGMQTMLAKLIEERKPVLLGVALEGGSSFRAALDARYKATRAAPPSELAVQLSRCLEIVDAYRILKLQAPQFEADDVIATMVAKAKAAGLYVVIASADKDLMQLVGDGCVMWDAMRDRVYGPPEVVNKFGVGPDRLRDLLALVGDSSDNIPGVPGIGPKTAADLLASYESLEGIYKNLDSIKKPKLRQSLIDNEADARISQTLVTLRYDAPVAFDKQALLYEGGDLERLRAMFTELGFMRQLASLPREAKAKIIDVKLETTTVLELDVLEAIVKEAYLKKRLAYYVHTTHEDAMRAGVCGLSLATDLSHAAYVPLGHRTLTAPRQLAMADVLRVLGPLLEDASIDKITHDAKRAEVVLRQLGVTVRGVSLDAMLGSYLLDPEVDHGLIAVAERHGGVKLRPFAAIAPKQRGKPELSLEQIEVDEGTAYGAPFGDALLRIAERQRQLLGDSNVSELATTLELPLSSVLSDLEIGGVLVDTGVLSDLNELMTKELSSLEDQARKAAGRDDLNVSSPKQLETILFDELGLKATRRTKTGRSTDAEALEVIADDHPLPRIVLEHRAIAKLKGTYVDALPRLIHPQTGRIHCHWRQAVAATGRISSEEPNLQNIPIRTPLGREIRKAFIAPPGQLFLSADYSQIELRVLAHLSQDPVMVEAFRTGQDIHVRTAMEVFGVDASNVTDDMRREMKTVNFGVIYGMGEVALSKNLSITRKEAAEFISRYFERYEGVARFMQQTLVNAKKNERVHTLLGRLRILPDLHSTDRMRRSAAERIAQNTPIQGTAADILKLAMVQLRQPVLPGVKMVLTVHDELDFEVPEASVQEAAAKIKAIMENVMSLSVPLVVDVGWGKSWAEAHG